MAKFDQTMEEYDTDDYLDNRDDLFSEFDNSLSDMFDEEMEQYLGDDLWDYNDNDGYDEEDDDEDDDEEFYNELMRKQ